MLPTGRPDRGWLDLPQEWSVKLSAWVHEKVKQLRRPGSAVVAVAVVVYGVVDRAESESYPSAWFWHHEPGAALLVLAAATAGLGSLFVVYGYRRAIHHRAREAPLYAACRDIAEFVARASDGLIDVERDGVGVTMWEVRGIVGLRYLRRRAHFSASERTTTRITWRRGKGVIGRCWESGLEQFHDRDAEFGACHSRSEFLSLARDRQLGLTWDEARHLARYKAVLAYALKRGTPTSSRIRGVLALDVRADGKATTLDQLRREHNKSFDTYIAGCEIVLGWRGSS
jgi:hypothetical protein